MKRFKFQHVLFSSSLKRALEREKISMGELAKKLRVTRSSVTQVLNSKSLTERTLIRYAAAIGYDVELRLKRRKGG